MKMNQVSTKSRHKHFWICALTGLLSGFLAFFICTHNFEFFWPLNWPMKITSVPGSQPVTVTRTPEHFDDPPSIIADDRIQPGVRVVVKHKGEVTGKVYSLTEGGRAYPIVVIFGKFPFDPPFDGFNMEGRNWECYAESEILEVLGK